ncbi:MAG: translation elongation factor Ts [Bacteroidales bacterium]|nr:translation elongation factor Ts [Bacteroidales bacterium]
MAITASDIAKLRGMTGAGLMDCKCALTEAEGDFDKAIEILRKKGQKIASKRQDRDAKEGCVLSGVTADGKTAVIVCVNCETDFVAKNGDFIAFTQSVLDVALNVLPANAEELKQQEIGGRKIADLLTDQMGKIGEKIDLGCYEKVTSEQSFAYTHMGNKLATVVGFNASVADAQVGKDVAMQVAAMSPVAVDQNDVPQSVIDSEIEIAKEKTVQEQIQKAIDVELKKAGINPNHVDSEDHMASNAAKGWITEEQVAQAKAIIAKVTEEKKNSIPAAMVENIAKGRLNKFFKESTLMNQEFVKDSKMTIAQYLESAQKGLKVTGFKRFGL